MACIIIHLNVRSYRYKIRVIPSALRLRSIIIVLKVKEDTDLNSHIEFHGSSFSMSQIRNIRFTCDMLLFSC